MNAPAPTSKIIRSTWRISGFRGTTMASPYHVPVLLKEAVESLDCTSSGIYVDGTLGGGGHAFEILRQTAPGGRLFGIDTDADALLEAENKLAVFGERKTLVQANFSNMKEVLAARGIEKVRGILLDLGVSSYQLDTAERGFSFASDAPLDMRLDQGNGPSAYDVVNTATEKELVRILRDYGEEQMAGRVARAIVSARRLSAIRTTGELAGIVSKAMPPQRRRGRIHPATKTFQAVRIAVNDELDNLRRALTDGVDLLETGGRLSIISFHSLEDRIVKETFRAWEKGCVCPGDIPFCICGGQSKGRVLTRKPVVAGFEELQRNPRARSAKLRTFERI